MKFAAMYAVMKLALVCGCSFYLFRNATRCDNTLRWYDRAIQFLGALLMAGLAIGGFLVIAGKLGSK
jgi:hypothetical protein